MAMRHPRLTVFVGAISALGLMTVLSGKLLSFLFDISCNQFDIHNNNNFLFIFKLVSVG